MECGAMAVLGAMVPGDQPKPLECGMPDTVLSKRVFKDIAIPSSLLLGRERDDSLEWCGFTQQRTSEKYCEFGWVEVRNNEPDSLKEQARLRIEAMDREGQTHVFWVTPFGRNRWKIPREHYTLLVVSSSGEKWSLEPAVIEVQKGNVEKCSMRYETRRVEEFKATRRQAIVPTGTPQHTQE